MAAEGFEPIDLWIMSPASYRTAPRRFAVSSIQGLRSYLDGISSTCRKHFHGSPRPGDNHFGTRSEESKNPCSRRGGASWKRRGTSRIRVSRSSLRLRFVSVSDADGLHDAPDGSDEHCRSRHAEHADDEYNRCGGVHDDHHGGLSLKRESPIGA